MKKYISKNVIELFLISCLGLFLEMACIRWLPSQVKLLSYYTNIVLLSAFLGLGIGYILARKSVKFIYGFPFALLLLMGICMLFSGNKIEIIHGENVYFWQTIIAPLSQIQKVNLKWILPLFFTLITVVFIPLGHQTGRLFDKISPIKAYTVNIFGSVTGIIVFSILSYNLMAPIWLFAIFMIVYLYFFYTRCNKVFFVFTAVIFSLILLWINHQDKNTFWSPYYKIQVTRLHKSSDPSMGFNLTVNNDYHQKALNLSDSVVKNSQDMKEWARLYELPFRMHGAVSSALIVGAGTGNDVAAALRSGVEHVDAVDIDPLILDIGKKHHPERPYDDKRVTVYTDDARSFLKKTDRKYDAVVFGFLDSHQLFSSMADIRLDTYVYTVESIREAKSLLKPNGMLSITFCVAKKWIGLRLYNMIKEATGEEPVILSSGRVPNGYTYVYGLSRKDYGVYEEIDPAIFGGEKIISSTDDWPFFYLKTPSISKDYWVVMLFVILFSVFAILLTRRSSGTVFDPAFFFLGAAFLLFETKCITHMSLLYGSTWIVNSAIFTIIFITILLANLYVKLVGINNLKKYYFLLFTALALNYFFPLHKALYCGFLLKSIVTALMVGLPIFFSAIIFVKKFSCSSNRSSAMGANLIGAMVGGVLEYSSMIVGFKSLIFIVILFYLLSMIKYPVNNRN